MAQGTFFVVCSIKGDGRLGRRDLAQVVNRHAVSLTALLHHASK
jgi:hypothetical protein